MRRRNDRACGSGVVSQYQLKNYAATTSSAAFAGARYYSILPSEWTLVDGLWEADVLHGLKTLYYMVQIMNESTGQTDLFASDDRSTEGVWKVKKEKQPDYTTRVTIIS